jgi:antitoxin component of MazEF toxin-antitoxin module
MANGFDEKMISRPDTIIVIDEFDRASADTQKAISNEIDNLDAQVEMVIAISHDSNLGGDNFKRFKQFVATVEKETTAESLTEDVSMTSSPENFKTLLGTKEFKEPISQEEVEGFFEAVKIVDNYDWWVDYRPAFESIAKEVDGKFDFAVNFNVYNEKIVMETSRAIEKAELAKVLDAMTSSKVAKENKWTAVYTGIEDNKNTLIKIQFEVAKQDAVLMMEETENVEDQKEQPEETPAKEEPAQAEAEVKVTAEIDKNITEEDVKKLTEVTEIDEESFNKKITESLCAVYENVESFTLTGCSLDDNKLILEGLVAFKSTKTRPTTYVFEAQELDKAINLVGTNSELFESCEINLTTTVIKESLYANELTYKYSVQGNLLEGLIRN